MWQQIIVGAIGVGILAYVAVRIVRISRGQTPKCSCGCGGCKSAAQCGKPKNSDVKNKKSK